MKDTVNITVAIATLDRPASLKRALDRLLDGTVLPREIIIVDQSSSEDTHRLIDTYQCEPVLLVYAKQAQIGLSASRNLAIKMATCPVVALTDDDCVPDEKWLAAVKSGFDFSPDIVAITGRILPLGPEVPGLFAVSVRSSTTRRLYRGKNLPWMVGSGANFTASRQWLLQTGGFDPRLGVGSRGKASEDMDMIYQLLRSGASIVFEPDAVIYHERQTLEKRLASRWNYGYGIGAFCGKWLRGGDSYSIYMLVRWKIMLLRQIAKSMLNRDWFQIDQRWRTLRGTVAGLFYGIRLESEGNRLDQSSTRLKGLQ